LAGWLGRPGSGGMVGDELGEVLKQMPVAASAMVAAKTAVL
jgi:hypothetical protein